MDGCDAPAQSSCSAAVANLPTLRTDIFLRAVLQVFYNVEVFVRTFPTLEQKPAAIFMGGGFDRTEFEIAYSVPGASSVAWFRPLPFKPGNEHMLGKPAPPADVVAAAARKAIDEHVGALREGTGAGKIWYY